jgi:hypothetical protein
MNSSSHKHRGVGSLTSKHGRRGWGSVGPAGGRVDAVRRAPARSAVRPLHEGGCGVEPPPVVAGPLLGASTRATIVGWVARWLSQAFTAAPAT